MALPETNHDEPTHQNEHQDITLEVVINRDQQLPEPVPNDNPPVPLPEGDPRHYLENDRHSAPESWGPYPWKPRFSTETGQSPWAASFTDKTASRRKLAWMIIGGVLLALVIIAGAVAGGIFGSRAAASDNLTSSPSEDNNNKNNNTEDDTLLPPPSSVTVITTEIPSTATFSSSSSSTTTTTTTRPTPSSPPKSIKPNSPLSAVGWRESRHSENFHLSLFFVDPSGVLRRTKFSSATNSWSTNSSSAIESFPDISLLPNSSFSAAVNIDRTPLEIHLHYLDSSSRIRGERFQESRTSFSASETFRQPSNLSLYSVPVSVESKQSTYWPVMVTQNERDNSIQWFKGYQIPRPNWTNSTLPLNQAKPAKGTGLVVLPLQAQYQNAGFLYVDAEKGELGTYFEEKAGDVIWGLGSTGIKVPNPSGHLAGFVYARGNDINTVALFQDDSDLGGGDIMFAYQSDGSKWKGPLRTDVLKGADRGTQISCVTVATWGSVGLRAETDANRCFFQVGGGHIKEVRWGGEGTGWVDLGIVPVD
ncbi:hypothetical protein QBC35DRAFT_529656 [Podospora australis]|uniref:Fucose-specific lectin n=1 Tax=Podospora australis TaxID=1536484 RepID=A0AAN7AJB4_9PEZI|nr:hypothetical protein QBC35DRAFT_529656 [Podospora australis]